MYETDAWEAEEAALAGILRRLTGDSWRLRFRKRATRQPKDVSVRPGADIVCLFSGGADSLCGAVRALASGQRVVLVSHWDWSGHSSIQRQLASALEETFSLEIPHTQFRIAKRTHQVQTHEAFPNEPTRRSRSLLFIALGLAVGSVTPEVPLWVPENGFASLNPPLAGERRGSLSTRTTHPAASCRPR